MAGPWLYFAESTTGADTKLRRVDLSTFALDGSSLTTSATTRLVGPVAPAGTHGYAIARQSPDLAIKIDLQAFTETATVSLPGGAWLGFPQIAVDEDAGYLYAITGTNDGVDEELLCHKIRMSDLVRVGTLSLGIAVSSSAWNYYSEGDAVVIDATAGKLYVSGQNLWSEQLSGATFYYEQATVDLATFTVDGVRRTDPSHINAACGFSDGTYFYTGGATVPYRVGYYDPPATAQVERIPIAGGSASVAGVSNYNAGTSVFAWFECCIHDSDNGLAYFGTGSVGDVPRICKINLSTFTITATLELNTSATGRAVRALAQDDTYLYAAVDYGVSHASQWAILRISKSTFTVSDTLTDASFTSNFGHATAALAYYVDGGNPGGGGGGEDPPATGARRHMYLAGDGCFASSWRSASGGDPEPETDPYWSNVVLLLRGEGTDGSSTVYDDATAADWKTSNGPHIETDQSVFGSGSLYFPGTGVLSTKAYQSTYNIGTGDFTVECWARSADVSNVRYIFMHPHTGGYSGGGWYFFQRASGAPAFGFADGTSEAAANGDDGSTPGYLSLNTWHHIAATVQVVGADRVIRLFLDGAMLREVTTALVPADGNTNEYLMQDRNSLSRAWNGHIDNLRITAGVARYTAAFTPPTEDFPTA